MEINQFDPNIKQQKQNQQKTQSTPKVGFDAVLASKLGEKVASQFVNPNDKVNKQHLDKKSKVSALEESHLEEDGESVPVIVKGLKKTIKKLIELEQRFLGL
jgi:hypothetical protein